MLRNIRDCYVETCKKKEQLSSVRGLQKLENMYAAINLDSCRNWSMKGKEPTVYWWIVRRVSCYCSRTKQRWYKYLLPRNPFLFSSYHIFLLKHTQTSLTWLQQPTFLQVECSTALCCYDAEESPSIGDASRPKIKLTFENNFKTLFASSWWILFIKYCVKGTEFVPSINYRMNPMQPVTSTFTTTVQQEQSNNWITIQCNSLCMHDYLVTAF
jgi:hypothetical protein